MQRTTRAWWHGLLADDPGEHPDAQLSVPTRQRAQIGWNFLSGQWFAGWASPPPVGAGIAPASASGAGDNRANGLTQKARTRRSDPPSDGSGTDAHSFHRTYVSQRLLPIYHSQKGWGGLSCFRVFTRTGDFR